MHGVAPWIPAKLDFGELPIKISIHCGECDVGISSTKLTKLFILSRQLSVSLYIGQHFSIVTVIVVVVVVQVVQLQLNFCQEKVQCYC